MPLRCVKASIGIFGERKFNTAGTVAYMKKSFCSFRLASTIRLALTMFAILSVGGCSTDCIYESYKNSDGQDACARVCPLNDAEGNEITDSNGKTVYESPQQGEDVNRINCDPFRSVSSSSMTTSGTTTSGTTSTTTTGSSTSG